MHHDAVLVVGNEYETVFTDLETVRPAVVFHCHREVTFLVDVEQSPVDYIHTPENAVAVKRRSFKETRSVQASRLARIPFTF